MTDINTTSQHFLQLANVLQQLLLKRLLSISLFTPPYLKTPAIAFPATFAKEFGFGDSSIVELRATRCDLEIIYCCLYKG